MKLLAEISEATLGIGPIEQLGTEYTLRKSARVILLNTEGEMALQYLATYNFHKLPGGGVDQGEMVEEALKREIHEEVGANCEIGRALGIIVEYREKYKLVQISYGFVAQVQGEISEPTFEPAEIESGQVNLWVPPAEAVEQIRQDSSEKYEALFNQARELVFLDEYFKTQD